MPVLTDAEKLAAIEALMSNPPGRKYVGTDELRHILGVQPYNPTEGKR